VITMLVRCMSSLDHVSHIFLGSCFSWPFLLFFVHLSLASANILFLPFTLPMSTPPLLGSISPISKLLFTTIFHVKLNFLCLKFIIKTVLFSINISLFNNYLRSFYLCTHRSTFRREFIHKF